MKRYLNPMIGTLLCFLALAPPLAAQDSKPQIRPIEQFDEVIQVPKGGRKALSEIPAQPPKTAPRRIQVRQWIIDGGQKASIPTRGMMLIELKAGDLTTITDGNRQERREGEFWTVPRGAKLVLETEDDSAVIETTVIAPSGN